MHTTSEMDSNQRNITRRSLLCGAVAAPPVQQPVRVLHEKGEKVSFLIGDKLLFEYRYSPSRPKTYVHPLCAPDGSPLSVDGPEDHVHLRGVMLAWSGVNGFDFWGEVNPAPHGQIVHQRFEEVSEKPEARLTSIEHWIADGRLLMVERRTIGVPKISSETVWLEWTSELNANERTVRLSAERHVYNGLGVRVIRSMRGGTVVNSNGTSEIEKANGEKASWSAYHGTLNRGLAGVAIFDHPNNPRHPTPFFVMNKAYGYLSAAPTYYEPFQLEPGRPLRLRYAVIGYLGQRRKQRLEELYRSWCAM